VIPSRQRIFTTNNFSDFWWKCLDKTYNYVATIFLQILIRSLFTNHLTMWSGQSGRYTEQAVRRKPEKLSFESWHDRGPFSLFQSVQTGYGLDGPVIESRWGARYSAPVQTGPGAHTASSTMGTRPFLGVKSGRGVTLTPHALLV